MKFLVFVFLAVVATCCAVSDPDALERDLKAFEPLIPKAKIVLIAAKHLVFDRQFRRAKNFLGTDESNVLVLNIMKSRPFRDLVKDVNKSGINAVFIINSFSKILKFPSYPENFDYDDLLIEPRTLGTFIDQVIAALPKNDFRNLMREKMRTNPDFKKIYDKLQSADFKRRVQTILTYPGLAPTYATYRSHGIDCNEIMSAVYKILDWAK